MLFSMSNGIVFHRISSFGFALLLSIALAVSCLIPLSSFEAFAESAQSQGAQVGDSSLDSDANGAQEAQDTSRSASSQSSSSTSSTDSQKSSSEGAAASSSAQSGAASQNQGDAAQVPGSDAALQAEQAIAQADSALAAADAKAGELAGLEGRLSAAHAEYGQQAAPLAGYQRERQSADAKILTAKQDIKKAQSIIDAAHLELALGDGYGLLAVMVGIASFDDIESRPYLLQVVIESEQQIIDDQHSQINLLQARQASYDVLSSRESTKCAAAIARVDAAAYEIERCCSLGRQAINDARASSDALDTSLAGVAEAKERISSALASDNASIGGAESLVGAWYDELDAASAANGAISYGQGIDFSLDETAFVEKWGSAIDRFYSDTSAQMGDSPLNGYGRKIATEAYRFKIDPRLCAAVSIAESSGGRICIKPYNAWGWGAADSDPYNLASGWSSWDEAIEAWHRGMATSKTGLASAPTVSALAAIYCSTPVWGATVITQMEKISEYAAVD